MTTKFECKQCHMMFEPKRSDAKYCSDKCRVAAKRERDRMTRHYYEAKARVLAIRDFMRDVETEDEARVLLIDLHETIGGLLVYYKPFEPRQMAIPESAYAVVNRAGGKRLQGQTNGR